MLTNEQIRELDNLHDKLLRQHSSQYVRIIDDINAAYNQDDLDMLRIYDRLISQTVETTTLKLMVNEMRKQGYQDCASVLTEEHASAMAEINIVLSMRMSDFKVGFELHHASQLVDLILEKPERKDIICTIIAERGTVTPYEIRAYLERLEQHPSALYGGTL